MNKERLYHIIFETDTPEGRRFAGDDRDPGPQVYARVPRSENGSVLLGSAGAHHRAEEQLL